MKALLVFAGALAGGAALMGGLIWGVDWLIRRAIGVRFLTDDKRKGRWRRGSVSLKKVVAQD